MPTKGMSAFIKGLNALKVKEVPAYLSKTVTYANISHYGSIAANDYRIKYISTSSYQPVYHVIGGVFVISYIMSWPTEYRHMMHQKAEAAATAAAAAAVAH
jgi:hypothetical protein